MRMLFSLLGLIALLVGILWIGQGLGYVQWPANNFMINEMQWTYYGCGLAFVGLIVLWISRR